MPDYGQRVRDKRAEELNGEALLGATLVYPPGSSLYTTALRGSKAATAAGGTVAGVLVSKLQNQGVMGTAASIPRSWGILALTERRLLWFEAKPGLSVGPQPKALLLSWPADEVELTYEAKGLGGYPTFGMTFADGSSVVSITEKTHQPQNLADAWARSHGDGGMS